MVAVEEVRNALIDFPKNARFIGLSPKSLARHIQYDGWFATRSWISGQVYPPMEIALMVAKWAQFLRDNPLPKYEHGNNKNAYESRVLVEGVRRLGHVQKCAVLPEGLVQCSEKQLKTEHS